MIPENVECHELAPSLISERQKASSQETFFRRKNKKIVNLIITIHFGREQLL
jgi:hypothetical protein